MQDCFRQHPEMYGSELEDDEDELEDDLRAEASPRSSEAPQDITTTVERQPQPSQPATQQGSKPALAGDEGGELVPKVAHDGKSE